MLLGEDRALRGELPSGPISFVARAPDAIATQTRLLLDDPSTLREMSRAALRYREGQTSWRTTAERYLTLLAAASLDPGAIEENP